MSTSFPPLRLQLRPKEPRQPVSHPISHSDRAIQTITLRSQHSEQDNLTLFVKVHPRARNLAIRLDTKGGHFVLTKPPRTPISEAERFAQKHQKWIRKQLEQLAPRIEFHDGVVVPFYGEPLQIRLHDGITRPTLRESSILIPPPRDTLQQRLQRYLQNDIRQYIHEQVPNLIHGINTAALARSLRQPPEATISRLTDPATRWGSCSHSGRLTFSWRLVFAPKWVSHYVITHEVAHLYHFNHSQKFWRLVDALTPHRDSARQWLRQNGDQLLRYGPPPDKFRT
ncbi:MAG: M48 family metallopeptidase [Alphaproteobacteria bacterium]